MADVLICNTEKDKKLLASNVYIHSKQFGVKYRKTYIEQLALTPFRLMVYIRSNATAYIIGPVRGLIIITFQNIDMYRADALNHINYNTEASKYVMY